MQIFFERKHIMKELKLPAVLGNIIDPGHSMGMGGMQLLM